MIRGVFVFLFTVSSFGVFSQIDSLKNLSLSKTSDTAKAACYIKIAKMYYNTEGILDSSLYYYQKAAEIYNKNNLISLYAKALNGKGLIYREKGDYKAALDNCLQALSLSEQVKDTIQLTAALNGIAIVNQIQKNFDKAFEYYTKCENIHLLTHNTSGLASTYNNLGLLFSDKNEPEKSYNYFLKSLAYNEQNKNERGVATACENIGLHFLNFKNNPNKAMEHFKRSVAIWRRMKDVNSVAITLDYIVSAMYEQKRYKECLDTARLSLLLAKQAGSVFSEKQAHEKLYMLYDKLGNTSNSFEHYKKFIELRDSLNNNEKLREITEMQLTYEFEKQRELEKLKQELKQNELSDKISRQKNIILVFIAMLIVVLVFAVLIWRSYMLNKKAKEKIAFQHLLLEEQNKSILDSIKYAKHIQEAILPPLELVQAILPDSFIYYKPKDIVSGDFYWVEEKDNKIYFAVVDCTGHGVPGAFISIVGRNGLNEAVANLQNPTTAQILDFLNAYVNKTLNQTIENSAVKDGMDIALCMYDKLKKTIQFSGANNPMWIVRAESSKLPADSVISIFGEEGKGEEYKADKQPIGNFVGDITRPFTFVELNLSKGDIVYLSSDGFSDQFGGPKRKKFKRSQFKKLLHSVSGLSLHKQREMIECSFEEWKGKLEQIDDVCVMGIRFS